MTGTIKTPPISATLLRMVNPLIVTITAGRLPELSELTMSGGTSLPVADLPRWTSVVRSSRHVLLTRLTPPHVLRLSTNVGRAAIAFSAVSVGKWENGLTAVRESRTSDGYSMDFSPDEIA